jgi:peptidyl-prolyl cis-trans isomerase C
MPAVMPAVIAKVNGESIESWELDSAVKQAEQRAGSGVPADKKDAIYRGMLDELVALHALSQESRARKFDVTDADVNTQMAAIRQNFPTEEAYQQGLLMRNLTVDHLRAQTRMSLLAQKLIEQEINSKVAVQDAEVDAFYKQNVDRFKEGESVHASHILISAPENADQKTKDAARAKAAQILKDVKAGKDFATLAKAQSQDPGSAEKGGDLGFFPKGAMTPTFEKVAFQLKPGAVSDVVETPFGFHIIKVLERRPARTVPLTEAAPQIKDYLTEGQRQSKLQQFVEQIKAKSKIQVLV